VPADLVATKVYGPEAVLLVVDLDIDPWVWAFMDLAKVAAYQGELDKAVEYINAGVARPSNVSDYFCLAFVPTFLVATGHQDPDEALIQENAAKIEATRTPSLIAVMERPMNRDVPDS
jgi:hypothetical protein